MLKPHLLSRFVIFNLILSFGCKTPNNKSSVDAIGGFQTEFTGLAQLDKILEKTGNKKQSLSKLVHFPTDAPLLSYKNALSMAWLPAVSYGSATQIVNELLAAGFISESEASNANFRLKRVEVFRALARSYTSNSYLHIHEYIKEVGAARKIEIGKSMLPKLFSFALSSEDLNKAFESTLRKKLVSNWRVVDNFSETSVNEIMEFLKNGYKTSSTWVKGSHSFDLIFEHMTAILLERSNDLIRDLIESDPLLSSQIEKVRNDPRFLKIVPDHVFSLTAETLDYSMSSNIVLKKNYASDTGVYFFSGGALRASASDLFKTGSTQMIVVNSSLSNNLIFIFRGTQGAIDLRNDFDPTMAIAPPPFSGQVHGGFWKAFKELIPHGSATKPADSKSFLGEFLERVAHSQKRVWITGHSLGGGLAVLMGSQIYMNPKLADIAAEIYTFGAPMVGNQVFTHSLPEKWNSKKFRFVYQNDLIARINPLGTLWPDGLSINISAKPGDCELRKPPDALPETAHYDSTDGRSICRIGPPLEGGKRGLGNIGGGIRDHDIFRYVESLGNFKQP